MAYLPAQVLAGPPLLLCFPVAEANALLAAANGKLATARAPSHTQCCQLQFGEDLLALNSFKYDIV